MSFEDPAIDRHALTGADPQSISDAHALDGYLELRAIAANAPRELGPEVQQRADRTASLCPRAQLQHLPKQHEDSDHGGGFVVDRHDSTFVSQSGRKHTGGKRSDQTVNVSGAHAQCDQGEHVE